MTKKTSKLSDLHPAKRNARKHGQRNLDMIETSLRKFGTGRSILVDENSEVIAGSGTLQAAKKAGIKKVKMVDAEADELVAVRRTGLTQVEKDGLAVADNRSAELAEWNTDILDELSGELELDSFFNDDELASILDAGDVEAIKETQVQQPPTMMWLLIGVDLNSYGAVLKHIQALESTAGIIGWCPISALIEPTREAEILPCGPSRVHTIACAVSSKGSAITEVHHKWCNPWA